MNLLFTRSQMSSSLFSIVPLRVGGVVTFKLKAEMELTDEEKSLVKKYSFSKATLVASDTYEDLQRSFRPALIMGFVAAILVALFMPTKAGGIMGGGIESILIKTLAVPGIGILTMLVMTFVYFFEMRKSITLGNLLNGGRTFFCYSVVELDEQEKEILDLSKRLHATLEKARDWGGREINPIPIGEPFYLPADEYTHHHSTLEDGLYKLGSNLKKSADKLKYVAETAPQKMHSEFGNPKQPNSTASQQSTQPQQTPQQQAGNPQQPNSSKPNPTHPFSPKPPDDPNDVSGGEFG